MTGSRRILNIFSGLLLLVFSALLFVSPEDAIPVVLLVIGLGITVRGLQTLIYYFTMARYMVGGKQVLYRTIIFLDFGLFTSALSNHPAIYIILFIAGIHLLSGLITALRANEARQEGSSKWMFTACYALFDVFLFVLVIYFGLFRKSISMAVYIYAVGLINTAFNRIRQAFRRTAIVYIQ